VQKKHLQEKHLKIADLGGPKKEVISKLKNYRLIRAGAKP
jgi:hypothetical protein